jgi:hypothetical protein
VLATIRIRVNSIWSHLEKYYEWENAVKIGKWCGKTKIAIISSKNQFRPQFWAQIVAGVETHRYNPFLGPGDHFFLKQSYEENQVQKIRHRIYRTMLKTAKSTFVPGFSILPISTVDLEVIALFAWAPHTNSGIYIVKSATRLINSGNLHTAV